MTRSEKVVVAQRHVGRGVGAGDGAGVAVGAAVAPGAVGAALALGGGDGAALGGTQPAQSSLAPNWYDAVVEHQKAAPAPTSVQVWYSTPRYVKGKTHASGTYVQAS